MGKNRKERARGYTRALVGVREQGLYVVYSDETWWPLIGGCSASIWLVPNSEAQGTRFVELCNQIEK